MLTADAKVATVTLLLVDPEQRHRGVGRLLLKAGSQAARAAGCGELRILPPDEAPHLKDFCIATGFGVAEPALVRPLRKRP